VGSWHARIVTGEKGDVVRFEDFHIGQIFEAGPYVMEERSIIGFATEFDPQPFHMARGTVETNPWRTVIASGWHTCGVAMRLMVDHVLADSDNFGSPGVEYINWPSPVISGDSLHLKAEILQMRRSRSKNVGIIRWRWLLFNQDQQLVLDLVVTSLFGRRPLCEDR
jgi:acyl dehydratase